MANNIQWTPEQGRGIKTTGANLLVSAAAGSGKTAVLSARCAHLVCDARPPCDVDQLLVVTFTDAAAAEMKSRIERALRARLANGSDDRLERQLALVERAHVSTLHGFCSRLIRHNFHLLGLDPAFQVLDQDEQQLLRRDVARQVLADCYESEAAPLLAQLIDHYADGDDEGLIPRILRMHEMLCSVVDPGGWVRQVRAKVEEAAKAARLEDSELGRDLLALLTEQVEALVERCEDARRAIEGLGPQLASLAAYADELGDIASTWADILQQQGVDGLAAVLVEPSLPGRPRTSNNIPDKEIAAAAIDAIQDEMKKGKLVEMARFSAEQWREGIVRIAPLTGLLLDLVEEFGDRYALAKLQAQRLDFGDLERFALKILRNPEKPGLAPSGVARGCHRQFQHVLVDEYQDINEVQDAILYLVSHECVEAEGATPNLFCVGDVKQSIYRFRLADPARFLERDRAYRAAPPPPPSPLSQRRARKKPRPVDPNQMLLFGSTAAVPETSQPAGIVIDLQANFRSRAPLLEAINGVFRRLMTARAAEIQYDTSHELRPGADYPAPTGMTFTGAPIELHLLPKEIEATAGDDEELTSSEREASFVARRIRQLMGLDGQQRQNVTERAEGQWLARPIRFRDIVILLRSMKVRADQYADILRQNGIPVFREGGQGYFKSMEVRDVRALLMLLDNQQQDIPMAALIRSPLARLAHPEDCLARIRIAYRGRDIPFHRAAVLYASEKADELAAALRDLFERIARWRDLARHRPLAELIWQIYEETGYLAFCSGLADGAQRVANLIDLHQRAAQFGTFARQGLYRFLCFLDSLEAETDFGQASVLSAAADVVRIMSVHQSKGLEFPVVFLPELGKGFNLQDCSGAIVLDRKAGLGLAVADEEKQIRYPSLTSVLVEHSLRFQALSEEMRILYVAMTRAREHLILSGTCKDEQQADWNTRWNARPGALSPAEVQAANSMLGWIGPASVMLAGAGVFEVTAHPSEEVAQWSVEAKQRPTFTPEQEALARLEPLSPAPAMTDTARAVIDRLTVAYPHAVATRLEASRSVTSLTKKDRQADAGYALPQATDPDAAKYVFKTMLAQPRCLAEEDALSATEKGTAMHAVLELLDFARPCDEADLSLQIQELVERRLITPAQAEAVDHAALHWLLASEIGPLLRGQTGELRREQEFHFAEPAPELETKSSDLLDQIMLRGRLDAMIVEPGGLVILDYKTDRVEGEALIQRIAFYRPQVELYRKALGQITSLPVKKVFLVFLHPRKVVPM